VAPVASAIVEVAEGNAQGYANFVFALLFCLRPAKLGGFPTASLLVLTLANLTVLCLWLADASLRR